MKKPSPPPATVAKTEERELMISSAIDQVQTLLAKKWGDIELARASDKSIKVAIGFDFKWNGTRRTVKATIGFGRRFKASETEDIEVDQLALFGKEAA